MIVDFLSNKQNVKSFFGVEKKAGSKNQICSRHVEVSFWNEIQSVRNICAIQTEPERKREYQSKVAFSGHDLFI